MSKKLLKRFMIAEDKLMQNKTLQYVSKSILQHNVWHLNRRSAGRGVFIGLFWAFIPMPMQMIPAIFCCIWARANLPLSVALVWLTNPVTMPPILYAAYKIGAFLLHTPTIEFQLDWEWVKQTAPLIWQPLVLGCLLLAISFASTGYTVIDMLWRWTTARRWQQRRQSRQNRHHS